MPQKRKQYVKLADGTLEQQYIATSADIVEIEAITGITATDVQGALEELKDLAYNGGVSSVNNKTGAVTIGKSDVGLGNVNNTSDANKPVSTAQQTAIDTAKNAAISSANSYTNGALGSYIPTSQKGAASGVATLGTDGKVPSSQLPSYVDDVVEGTFTANATTPAGETGKIYVDTSTGKTFRWSGSKYVEISSSLALGETSSTAYAGDKGKQNASKISALEDVVYEILDNERNVGTANNALALGGVSANQYAKLVDIPFYVVSCYLNDTTVSWANRTYEAINLALDGGQVPILLVYYPFDDYRTADPFYFQSVVDDDYYTFTKTLQDGLIETITVYSSNDWDYSTMTVVSTVQETGTGAIVSKIEKSGGAVNVTRRAMQNSDLPNSGVTAGVYSAVQVNSKGVVTSGNQLIEWGTDGQTAPSANLAIGGLFFMKV